MHKTLETIHSIRDHLVGWAKEEVDNGKERCCTQELTLVIDMIKDLCEVEKDCKKACYYHLLCEDLVEDELEENERMGYDNRRYSSGRYAPKGKGHYSPIHTPNVRMGYNPRWMDERYESKEYPLNMIPKFYTNLPHEQKYNLILELFGASDPETKQKIKNDIFQQPVSAIAAK